MKRLIAILSVFSINNISYGNITNNLANKKKNDLNTKSPLLIKLKANGSIKIKITSQAVDCGTVDSLK